jgi:hypothetical protein
MDGLTLGLTFGLAVAGGVSGFVLNGMSNFATGLVGVFARDRKIVNKASGGYVSSALIGAFAGAVLGFGIGKSIDYISAPSPVSCPQNSISMLDINGKPSCMPAAIIKPGNPALK